jgi:hypothetical protein
LLTVTAFASLELPPRLIVQINANELEHLRAWPQVAEFFRNYVVDLSFSGPVDAQYLLDQTRLCRR